MKTKYIKLGLLVLLAFLTYKFFTMFSKGLIKRNMKNYSSSDIKKAFLNVQKKYGYSTEFMRKIEQLARVESRHFDSLEFKITSCFGMVARTSIFPYGWSSLATFCKDNGINQNEFKTIKFNLSYVVFPDLETSIHFVCWFIITQRHGNVYAWNSLNEKTQNKYRTLLNSVKTRFF